MTAEIASFLDSYRTGERTVSGFLAHLRASLSDEVPSLVALSPQDSAALTQLELLVRWVREDRIAGTGFASFRARIKAAQDTGGEA